MSVKATGTIGRDHYYTEIKAGKNSVISDEPIWNGGEEKGMNPFELLASSLVACTCATLRMYADRKEWGVEKINVEVTLERNPKEEMTSFVRQITIEGEITSEQEARLLLIANKCPVHQILNHKIEIETTLSKHGN